MSVVKAPGEAQAKADAAMADGKTPWTVVCPRPLVVRVSSDFSSEITGELRPGEAIQLVKTFRGVRRREYAVGTLWRVHGCREEKVGAGGRKPRA